MFGPVIWATLLFAMGCGSSQLQQADSHEAKKQEPAQTVPAGKIPKERALAILTDSGTKQLGNWINIDRKDDNWHFAAIWKTGASAYYVVDGSTGEILYSNTDTKQKAIPERFTRTNSQESYHIVDQGVTPIIWVKD